jgi:hypothetical protein
MQLPGPVRAVVGLVATAADEARHLPDRALELPMLAVSTALQASIRAQQRYARLTARGDALLNRRPPTDEPPDWATFDDPLPTDELRQRRLSAFDAVDGADAADTATAAAQLIGDAVGRLRPGSSRPRKTEPRTPPAKQQAPAETTAKAATKTASAKKTAAKKTAARASAKKSSPAKQPAKAATKKSAGSATDTATGADS